MDSKTNFIFVTGGVVSSLGKGITAASLGALLESHGYVVTILKMDPYINVDPGTMNPTQHGEVFVTDDGAETDLDLGHYERFLSTRTSRKNSFTAGKVYNSVINNERQGKYLGETIQVIPHITDEIKRRIMVAGEGFDFCLVEVGGTCGDIESLPFLEAIRQFSVTIGRKRSLFVHLTLLPYISAAGEIKTKPTQHSVKELRSIGIQPDVLICRSETTISDKLKSKISLFTNVSQAAVFSAEDTDTIYSVPANFSKQKLDKWVIEYFNLQKSENNLHSWDDIVYRIKNPTDEINIALISKYMGSDSYKSINESLLHAGIRHQIKVNVEHIDAEKIEKSTAQQCLSNYDGILVPGGFGSRGTQGKILAINYARENKIPFLGICLGMQLAIIEYAQNVLQWEDVNSTELDQKCKTPVIALVSEWQDADGTVNYRNNTSDVGGTMRLGAQKTILSSNSLAHKIYNCSTTEERHRHRYEVNELYVKQLEEVGIQFSGYSEDKNLVEIIELPTDKHPWFFACQFHPELKSTPREGHPIFLSFTQVAWDLKNETSAQKI